MSLQRKRGQDCRCMFCILHILQYRTGNILHILRYRTGNIPLYFPVIPCAQQICWGLFEDFLKSVAKLFNSCKRLRTVPVTSANFRVISVHFRRFPKIFQNTSDAWHIPRYPTRKQCITSTN